MKLNRIITLCAMTAALALSVGDIFAQDNGGGQGNGGQGNGGGNGQRRNRQAGGNGGGQGGGQQGGGQGGGFNFDPAAMQQRMVDGAKDRLEFTNDTEWAAVEPLVKKVVAARFDVGMGGRGGFGGGRNRGGGQGGPGGVGQQSPEQDALQKALDDNAPSAQIKDLLAKYKAAQKAKQAKLEAAQSDLRKVLNTKQEAQATLSRLLD